MARVARPAVRSKKTVRPRRITHEEEALIEKATHEYNLRHYKSIRAAARAHNIEKHYFTLRRRVKGLALPKKVALSSQMNKDCWRLKRIDESGRRKRGQRQ